jgi:hypothetical protein
MNTSVRVSDLQRWQGCVGMCLVCGQPLGLSASVGNVVKQEENDNEGDEQESLLERLSLQEECPFRLCMMRFRLLGKREECHIVDQYTHLEKRSAEERFDRVFEKRKEQVVAVAPDVYGRFAHDIFRTGEFEAALAICRRVAKPLTFSGCRACNVAMERSSAHANTIYRCFAQTRDANVAALEENKQESIKTKKVLEQIALYFEWTGEKWIAKGDDRVLLDTCLWRCIAHIYCWGRTGKLRSRLVAIFHAANYMYLKSTFKGVVTLSDWHVHIFQAFYTQRYRDEKSATWFGLHQGEAAGIFDLARKEGAQWVEHVTEKLERHVLPDLEAWTQARIQLSVVQAFVDQISTKVSSERELICFVARRHGISEGLESLYSYYVFNVRQQAAYAEHFKRFMRELARVYQQQRSLLTRREQR